MRTNSVNMGAPIRRLTNSGNFRNYNNNLTRLVMSVFVGAMVGFVVGLSFPTLSLMKMNIPSSILPSIDLWYIEEKYSILSTHAFLSSWSTSSKRTKGRISTEVPPMNESKIWEPSNPRGAERLPPGIIEPESDLFLRRLWGHPNEDVPHKPKYLVTFTVGYEQKQNIDDAVKKFSDNFTIVLFHYDDMTSEWNEFEWSKKAIHVSARKQTKWWFAKRFLHPDIVTPFEYIFIWDEDLGVAHFNAEEYIKLIKKHDLEISQPGLDTRRQFTWQMTARKPDSEIHKYADDEKPGRCIDPRLPPCAAFVEIMAPVFSRNAWRCVWHMIQNDLVHGWGLDFALRRCVEPAYEKIGVVDTQWVVHKSVPTLGNQGEEEGGKKPWEVVRERCQNEWAMFEVRVANAEKAYFESIGIDASNVTDFRYLSS